jgi:hypothetical protein
VVVESSFDHTQYFLSLPSNSLPLSARTPVLPPPYPTPQTSYGQVCSSEPTGTNTLLLINNQLLYDRYTYYLYLIHS